MKTPKPVLLTGNCTDKKCKKRSVMAHLVGRMWIERCADHINREVTLDFNKIGEFISHDRPEVQLQALTGAVRAFLIEESIAAVHGSEEYGPKLAALEKLVAK